MRVFLLLMLLGAVSGCGSFGNILPDREKEYKYSSEIPPLEVPPDLTTSTIEDSPIRPGPRSGALGTSPRAVDRPSPAYREEVPVAVEPEPKPAVHRSAQGAYIRVEENFPIAWRMVGRALSRLEIEVEDLNRSEGLYYIIFEDRRKRKAEQGFWSSLAFWSDANAIEEQRFQVLVEDRKTSTEVRIMDEDGQGLSEGTGLDVLEMIQKKINEQIAEK